MSLSAQERVLIFLFYLAGNSVYWITRYGHWVSHGTVVNCIHQCLQAFHGKLVGKYIQLPDHEQARKEAALFHEQSKFPPIIWAAIGKVCSALPIYDITIHDDTEHFTVGTWIALISNTESH